MLAPEALVEIGILAPEAFAAGFENVQICILGQKLRLTVVGRATHFDETRPQWSMRS